MFLRRLWRSHIGAELANDSTDHIMRYGIFPTAVLAYSPIDFFAYPKKFEILENDVGMK